MPRKPKDKPLAVNKFKKKRVSKPKPPKRDTNPDKMSRLAKNPAKVARLPAKYDFTSKIKYLASLAWEQGFYITEQLAEMIGERLEKQNPGRKLLDVEPAQLWAEIRNIVQ